MLIEYKVKSDSQVQFCKGSIIYEDDAFIHISQEMMITNLLKSDLEYLIIIANSVKKMEEIENDNSNKI